MTSLKQANKKQLEKTKPNGIQIAKIEPVLKIRALKLTPKTQ